MRYYSNSEITTFKDCRRKWWLGSYRHLRLKARKVVGAAPIGSRVHEALAPWYVPEGVVRIDPRVALEEAIVRDRDALTASAFNSASLAPDPEMAEAIILSEMKDFEKEIDLCRAMIEGYVQWLEETGADSDYRVIMSEMPVSYEFASGESLIGRIDTQVEQISSGLQLGIDHKTGDFGALRKTLPQSEQMLLYEILRRVTFPDTRSDGMMFNMIRKVKRTAAAKPPFFDRQIVRFNQHQIESAWQRVMATINDIREVTRRLDAGESHLTAVYPRPNNDCSWKCEFFPVCPMFDDGSRAEDMLQSLYMVGDPLERYPELSGDTE